MKVREEDVQGLTSLPSWVKCMDCGGKPKKDDWLIEMVPNSSALLHQSCAAKKGQIAGLNAGTVREIGSSIQAVKGEGE